MRSSSIRRVARKHLHRRADLPGIAWFTLQVEKALDLLEEAADVADGRSGDETTLAEDYPAVSRAVRDIRLDIGRDLDQHIKALKATQSGGRLASRGYPLERQLRMKANAALDKAGLDGNTFFRKAEHGDSTAVEVIGKFGIEINEAPNSLMFTRPSGRFTIDLAWSNPGDPFSPEPIPNSMLVVTFHQMESGNFEVTAYLS